MNNEIIVPELNNETIESMIYVIRGVKVMLDFELARIYGYVTSAFNQQVKRNIDKFPLDFMFRLNPMEFQSILMSQNVTSSWGGIRKLPYAFTEQGIYMLMTILKGDLATKQSIALVKAFKQMKDYLIESNNLLSSDELLKLTNKVYSNEKNIEQLKNDNIIIKKKLEVVMDNFIDPNKYREFKIVNGKRIEAIEAYQMIFKLAKKSIYLIDDYVDIKTLEVLKLSKSNLEIIIISDNKNNKYLNKSFIDDFKKDTNNNLIFKKNNGLFHGRYIVIDFNASNYILYHSGPSIKDAGNKIDTINIIDEKESYIDLINKVLENDNYEI